ncbi:MAG TPA: MYXO-CTERM sorting domain-containing protein [Polyangia bacterium]
MLGVLLFGAVAAVPACGNDPNTTGIEDPALHGATVGEVQALVADMPDGTSQRQYFLGVAGSDTALRLTFAGEAEPMLTTGDRIGVWGDRLGDEFLVSRHLLIPLPADESSVTSALIGATPKPQTSVFVIVDVGGGSNITNDKANMTVFDPGTTFAAVYDKISFGILKMSGDVQGPFSYPMTTCDSSAYTGLKNAVKPMVQGTYNHYMWYFGSKVSACAWSGIGSEGNIATPQKDAWYNASTGCTVLVQEVGHNQGWMHSSTLACTGATFATDPTTCKSSEYGNRMTPMGSGCGMFNAYDQWYAGFLQGCNGVKVTSSGTYNLFALENACNGIQAIQIPMVATGRMAKPEQGNNQPLKNYMLEYRTKTGQDSSVTQGVYVYATDDIKASNRTSNWTWLLDMNPATSTFDGLAAGGTFTDPDGSSVKITVMSEDATKAVVQIDIPGGAGAAPTCIDSSTVAAPGPADCGSGPTTGTGGAGGSTGAGGAGGTTGSGGRGGTTGTGTGGRGGAGGSTTGTGGRGGTTGTGTGAGGSVVTTGSAGRGGNGGTTGTGTGGSIGGSGGTTVTTGVAGGGGSSTTTGTGGTTGTGTGTAGTSGPTTGAGGSAPPTGQAGTTGLTGVTGGCECAVNPSGSTSVWGVALFAVGLVVVRRRRRR